MNQEQTTFYIFFVQKKKLKMVNFLWTQHPFYYYLWTMKLRTYTTCDKCRYSSCTSNIHDSNTCTSQTTNVKVQLLFFLVQIDLFNNWSGVFCVLLEMPRHNKMSSTSKINYFYDFILYYSFFIGRKGDERGKKSTRLFAHNKLKYSHVSEVESKILANIRLPLNYKLHISAAISRTGMQEWWEWHRQYNRNGNVILP